MGPPFQITDRTRAQPRRLRQLLLSQPSLGTQLPQQPGEPQLRLLRHDPGIPPQAVARRLVVRHHAERTYAKITKDQGTFTNFVDVEPGTWTLDPNSRCSPWRGSPASARSWSPSRCGTPTDLAVWDNVHGLDRCSRS